MRIKPIYHLILVVLASACSEVHTPREALPPATQTGANTFGCLLNGKVWVPKGYNGTSNLSPSYDPNFNGQIIFDISAYSILSDKDRQYLGIAIYGLTKEGTYTIDGKSANVYFSMLNGCTYLYSYDSMVFKTGSITVSKIDLPIISGTFNFKVYKKDCGDTLKFSQGRFDIKL